MIVPTTTLTAKADGLAEICAKHLNVEADLLERARGIFVLMEQSFSRDGLTVLAAVEADRKEVEHQLAELRRRRVGFRETVRARFPNLGDGARLSEMIRACEPAAQKSLLLDLAKVRQLAMKLVTHQHWFAVHLQIHLDAYGRLLRDCIGSPMQSGRYGRDGRLPVDEYRPLLEVLG